MTADLDERELLSQYLADADRQAFAELMRRNGDLVYSAARQHLAEDGKISSNSPRRPIRPDNFSSLAADR